MALTMKWGRTIVIGLAAGAICLLLLLFAFGRVSMSADSTTPETQQPPTASEPARTLSLRTGLATAAPVEPPSSAPPESPERARSLQTENAELRSINQKLQSQLAEVFNWMLDNYKGRYPLRENQITNLNLAAVSPEFNVAPAVADFLHLNTEETEKLNDIFQYGGRVLQDIQDSTATLTETEDGQVILHFPEFSAEGALLQEDIYYALETTLGPVRMDRFMNVSKNSLNERFQYFGNASHTIVFEPFYVADDQPLLWQIKDGWVINEENGKMITATEQLVEELPVNYATYSAYLPPYLQPNMSP